MTPAEAREWIAAHFDGRAEVCRQGGDYGAKVVAQVWEWVAARVREVPLDSAGSGEEQAR